MTSACRIDLNEAASDVIALTRSEALKHGVSVQIRLAADLPSVSTATDAAGGVPPGATAPIRFNTCVKPSADLAPPDVGGEDAQMIRRRHSS